MAKKQTPKNKKTSAANSFSEAIGMRGMMDNDVLTFLVGIVLIFVAIYVAIAFVSYFSTGADDQSLVLAMRPGDLLNSSRAFHNSCNSFGALASHWLIARGFGLAAFLLPAYVLLAGLKAIGAYRMNMLKCLLCFAFCMVWLSVAAARFLSPLFVGAVFNPGGDHGLLCAQWLENIIGTPGLLLTLLLTALFFLTYLSAKTIVVIKQAVNPVKALTEKVRFIVTNTDLDTDDDTAAIDNQDAATNIAPVLPGEDIDSLLPPLNAEDANAAGSGAELVFDNPMTEIVSFPDGGQPVAELKETDTDATADTEMAIEVAASEEKADSADVSGGVDLSVPINPKEPWLRYKYPTLNLLKSYDDDGKPYINMEEQKKNKDRIIEVLASFGVQIRTIKATVGPTITLYEITPAEGVRISKIKNLGDDIALSLAALGIRIIAPIPGKGTVGIEVPNEKKNIVSMESILNSKRFQETTMELPIAIGKTITNEVYMVDLAKLPHLLVAGATGQGKSVGLNAIITSLLYKKHPNELKFVLVDPKKVEFSPYAKIANHFMARVPDEEEPIITDVTKVVRTLSSLCRLMDSRYDLLKHAGAKNIKEYNDKYVNRRLVPTDEHPHEFMPYIVVIIDEFGDLIMTAGKEVELPIARIAQLARAVGIHMIIATQRPTTTIITGNIKANFPGRMAFRVSASIDSRTILDRTGADQLIGRGDLLFLNGSEPVRVQCAFVDTPEIEDINAYISQQQGPLEPMDLPEPATDEGGDGDGAVADLGSLDPLFEEVARVFVAGQNASTSMIQSDYSIGFNRARRLVNQLEKAGIVGPSRGAKPREVLIMDMASLDALLSRLKSK